MKAWMDSKEVSAFKSVVAIVRFNSDRFPKEDPRGLCPQPPSVYFQVTIDRDNVSRSGRFIRFGKTAGDELNGWMRRDLLFIEEVLGELQEDGKTVKVLDLEDAA